MKNSGFLNSACSDNRAIRPERTGQPGGFRVNKEQGLTVKFFTLGCKVNQYETQMLREQFLRAGFEEVDNRWPAGVCLINTCTVTHRADADSLGIIRRAHRENPKAKIIVTGCLAELDADKIGAVKGVTGIFKNSEKRHIVHNFVSGNSSAGASRSGTRLPAQAAAEPASRRKPQRNSASHTISFFKNHARAFLKIQDGCNNFCSYCKVPLVRGRQKSRPLREIITEAKKLVENGFKEIVLTGICLGSYGEDRGSDNCLVDVIDSLENIRGLSRIRLSSIEAGEITSGLLDKLCVSKKLCRHLHIPLQSGDDAILRKMNRHYTQQDYLDLISRIKRRIPEVSITTDCLVGFPGETEDNFKNTMEAIKKAAPLKVHIFPFSQRSGTAASRLPRQLSQKAVKERIRRLKEIADDCSFEYRNKFLDKVLPVLVETRVSQSPCLWEGYTDNYIRLRLASRSNLGNAFAMVRLERIEGEYVWGSKL